MVHSLDPFLWQISGNFGIRWYGLSYLTGFVMAYMIILWMARRRISPLPEAFVADFITYVAFGTLIGGRLGYVIFYSPDMLWKFSSSFPFWGVFAVNEGGMASHGGILGVMVATLLFASKYHVNKLHLLDLVSLTGPLGLFFGRIANFINGELVGRPCDPSFPLSIKFPQDISHWTANEPQRVPELGAVAEKIGVTPTQWADLMEKFRFDSAARTQVDEIMNKIVEAIQNGNEAAKEAIAPLLTARHPSQLYQGLGEGLLVFLFLFFLWRKPRHPGFIGSVFVMSYALMRIIGEEFRMPDYQIGFQWLGLTRGQWLSVAMFVIGIGCYIYTASVRGLPLGGWKRDS
ncbi:MAG: prolipoprotein diacylglyceryl transferase [Pseudobdellovibrionaceae bacterium]